MSEYLDKANELTKGLNALFANLTLGSFLKWIITIIGILVISLFVYEYLFSSTFHYNKIDRELSIIEDAIRISDGDSLITAKAENHLAEIIESLDSPQKNMSSRFSFGEIFSESLYNYLIKISGALVFPLLIMFSSRNDPDNKNVITGGVVMIVVSALIAVFIPIIYSVWINFFLIAIFQILVIIPFIPKDNQQT